MESRSPPVSPSVVAQIFMIQKASVSCATLLAVSCIEGSLRVLCGMLRPDAAAGTADERAGGCGFEEKCGGLPGACGVVAGHLCSPAVASSLPQEDDAG